MVDEWTVVKSKRKPNKGKARGHKGSHPHPKHHDDTDADIDIHTESVSLVASIQHIQSLLSHTAFHTDTNEKTKHIIDKCVTIIMLGIGNFSTSKTALLQLCYGLYICSQIKDKLTVNATIYDPVMRPLEIEVCKRLGLNTVTNCSQEMHTATTKTLFYMPHCPYLLYSQILWANWGSRLENVVILGNSFNSYSLRRMGEDCISDRADCVQRLMPLVQEVPLWLDQYRRDPFLDRHWELSPLEGAFTELSLMILTTPSRDNEGILSLSNRPTKEDMDAAAAMDLELITPSS